MSYPDLTELSNAYTLCTCSIVCSRACTVCASTTWEKGPCVKQLWAEHETERLRRSMPGPTPRVTWKGGKEPDVLSDAEIVERTIDFVEQLGMYMEPWQAAALRAILLHGGDVELRTGIGYR